MSYAIGAFGLTKRFHRTPVLDGLHLEVPEGSIYALTGRNGAGKTTAIKILMNILAPGGGRCEVLGADSRRLGPAELAQIGYVSENQEMPGWMTVGFYLEFLRPFYPKWDTALENELVAQFQLPRNRKLAHLSRGMRMKAALASSLAYRPRAIVLDEPFTGLDALVRDELIEGLLARAENTTVLISSHDLAEIESFASHVGYLEGGRLQFSESLESLSGRFREIALTFEKPPAAPDAWPHHWLGREAAGNTLHFVATQYDAERTPAEIRRMFPEAQNIETNGMTLRSIFLALAKSGGAAN
jgi:ABC-2 type transport system ATP-binding protein